MRLLTPSQGKSRRDLSIEDGERRLIELDGLLRDKRIELQKLDVAYIKKLSEGGIQRLEEETLWNEKIRKLTEEVEQLEERRKRALVPLEEKENELQDRGSVLLKREEQVKIKESDLEYTKELLEKRLDDISEREQDATDFSVALDNRKRNLELQEGQLKSRMDALTEVLRQSYEDMKLAEQEAAKYKAILKGRNITLEEREKRVEAQEKSFVSRETRLLDRYRTLQRAITETNLKQNVSKSNTTRSADKRDRNG